jgi:hypothetical protein
MLEFGEEWLDRVQVGRIFGKEQQLCSCCTDGLANRLALVRAQIVHDDDIARLQGRDQFGFHIGPEALAVDRAIEDPGRFNPVMTQGSDEGLGLPMAVRNDGLDPLATLAPATKRAMFVFVQDSSMNTSRLGSIRGAYLAHC